MVQVSLERTTLGPAFRLARYVCWARKADWDCRRRVKETQRWTGRLLADRLVESEDMGTEECNHKVKEQPDWGRPPRFSMPSPDKCTILRFCEHIMLRVLGAWPNRRKKRIFSWYHWTGNDL